MPGARVRWLPGAAGRTVGYISHIVVLKLGISVTGYSGRRTKQDETQCVVRWVYPYAILGNYNITSTVQTLIGHLDRKTVNLCIVTMLSW